VVAATAQEQALEATIPSIGTLEADERVDVKSEIDGTIASIEFEEGQRVAAGQVLVRFDQAKLRASLAEAQANLQLAETTRQRYATLLQAKAVSQQEADQASAAWAANQALVERLTAELEEATIAAPFAGVTGARLLSVGQFIPRGTTITTLIDPDPMKLEFRLPERFLGQVRSGQPVKLETAAYPDVSWTGEVYFIDPQIDEPTRTVLVKAAVPNPDGRLRRGMFAQATLVLHVREDAVVIPETAVLHQGDLTFVYAIDVEQTAQMRPVKIGQRLADSVEVVEGLQAGEQVVAEGHQKLHPGAKVAPREPAPAAATPDPA
jgi:membrane fusion protein (multidrug efflux system)